MSSQRVVFDAEYSSELIEQAARAFRDYLFKRYGPWLIAACIVNALGVALSLWLGAETGGTLAGVVFIAVLGPVWLFYEYFLSPLRYAARLKRFLPSHGQVSVDSTSVLFTVSSREIEIPLSSVKVLVETNELFLFVLSPFAFTFLPKSGLPVETSATLHARAQSGAV